MFCLQKSNSIALSLWLPQPLNNTFPQKCKVYTPSRYLCNPVDFSYTVGKSIFSYLLRSCISSINITNIILHFTVSVQTETRETLSITNVHNRKRRNSPHRKFPPTYHSFTYLISFFILLRNTATASPYTSTPQTTVQRRCSKTPSVVS